MHKLQTVLHIATAKLTLNCTCPAVGCLLETLTKTDWDSETWENIKRELGNHQPCLLTLMSDLVVGKADQYIIILTVLVSPPNLFLCSEPI